SCCQGFRQQIVGRNSQAWKFTLDVEKSTNGACGLLLLPLSSCWRVQERGSRIRVRRLASLTCGNYRNEWIAPAAGLFLRFGASVVREMRMHQSISKAEFDCAIWWRYSLAGSP